MEKSRKLVFGADFGCCVPRVGAASAKAVHQSREWPLYTNASQQQEASEGTHKDAEPTGVLVTSLGRPAERPLCDRAEAGARTVPAWCPGFSADGLEILEEIAIRAAALFRSCGGEALHDIPALDDRADPIAALADILTGHSLTVADKEICE